MSFLRKGLVVSGGQTLGVFLGVLANIIFARSLGPGGMGQFELLRTTAIMAVTLLAMGLGNATIYFLNNRKVPIEAVASNAVRTSLVLGLLMGAGMASAILAWPRYFGHVPTSVIVVYSAACGAFVSVLLLRPILIAQLAARRMVAVDLIQPVVLLGGGAVLAAWGWLRPGSALVVLGAAFTCAMLLLLVLLRRHIRLRMRFDWGLLWGLLKYGVKLAAGNILYLLSLYVTVMFLRLLRPDRFDEVGLYGRAVAICSLITMLPRQLSPLLYAKWSAVSGADRRRQAELVLRTYTAYGVLCVAAVMVFGKYVLWLLYGQEFVRAQEALCILAPATFFLPLFSVCSNLLAGDGRAMTSAKILAGTVVVVGVTSWLAVPAWGIRGAATAALCGYAFDAIVGLWICTRLYGIRLLHALVLTPQDVRYGLRSLFERARQTG